jgi:hypothetical protein
MKIKFLIAIIVFLFSAFFLPARADAAEEPVSFLANYALVEKYLIEPQDQIKVAKYISLLAPLMKDRSQTLRLDDHGFSENNPLLGRRPSNAKINSYFAIFALSSLATFNLPEPFASSILDSIRYQEEIVTYENERLFSRKAAADAAPIALMFTVIF